MWSIMNTMPDQNLRLPDGLMTDGSALVIDKINSFRSFGPQNVHYIFDFDRTMTTKHPGTKGDVTTWHILSQHLPPDGLRSYSELFDIYRAQEIRGDLSNDDAVRWWSSILDLFVEHRINLFEVERDFLDKASIRPGTKELFILLRDAGIPTVILSAGIRDVIDIWCKKYDIDARLVLSTMLKVDHDGTITGWHADSLVHVLNKSEVGHPELASLRKSRPNVVLIGDSMDDALMSDGIDNVLRIRILDRREDDDWSEDAEVARTLTRFDAFVSSGSLVPILEFARTTLGDSN